MRRNLVAPLTVAAISVGLGARAAADDVPGPGTMSMATKAHEASFECSPLRPTVARPRAHCTFTETVVTPARSPADVEKEAAGLEDQFKKHPADLAKDFTKLCTGLPNAPPVPEGPPGTLFGAYKAACQAGSLAQFVRVTADYVRDVEGHTCKIEHSSWQGDFERVDVNTWISTTGPEGDCHISHVDTLWHEPSASFEWNYRDVSTQPDSKADSACARIAGTHVDEYSWKNTSTIRDLGCRYFEM
jgi:hypothetical protein